MIFKNSGDIGWFFVLLPVLVLMIWGYKKRFRFLAYWIQPKLWSKIVPTLSFTRRFWKRFFVIISLAFLILALLRPQYGVVFQQVERKGHDIFIAFDLSKSMLAQDVSPSRLEHAKREVLGLINELKGDRIGFIAFAGDAYVQCPLTSDYAALTMFLDVLHPDLMGTPGTDIATAIKTARLSFNRVSKRHKPILIIISDGESFENDPIESAEVAAEQNVTIYTIGIGSKTGEPIPEFNSNGKRIGYKKDERGDVVVSKLNDTILTQVANVAGGRYFHSSLGSFVMDEVYKEISRFEKERLEETLLQIHQDRYQWFLAIAFILLLLDSILSDRKRPKTNLEIL